MFGRFQFARRIEQHKSRVTQYVQKALNENSDAGRRMNVLHSSLRSFLIPDGSIEYNLDSSTRYCACGYWSSMGYLCAHALVMLLSEKRAWDGTWHGRQNGFSLWQLQGMLFGYKYRTCADTVVRPSSRWFWQPTDVKTAAWTFTKALQWNRWRRTNSTLDVTRYWTQNRFL